MTGMAALPRRQQQLHDLLFGKGDVLICDLFDDMKTGDTPDYADVQSMQRWLGNYVAATNRSIAERNLRIEPGDRKNSYRLVVLSTT